MREPVRDRDRLEHIVEALDRILKNLVQIAERMKKRGYETEEISRITGLSREDIDSL